MFTGDRQMREPESSNEGGMFRMYEEPLSANEEACSTCLMSRYRQTESDIC